MKLSASFHFANLKKDVLFFTLTAMIVHEASLAALSMRFQSF